ncbi:MAG TPA: hypothetical protein VLI72_12255 [Methylibium sp.]|nr:hypothetical protein [Methylibium sp.]
MQGQLFTQDFLHRGIRDTPPWQELDDAALQAFTAALRTVFDGLGGGSTLNEAQTEQVVIERVLVELGWGSDYLPQVNLSKTRREDVPDVLLFPDATAKAAALAEPKDDRRYRHGLAILEAKRWLRPLDRGDSGDATDPGAPSSQMLRYLSRVDVVADRAVKWGVLTNGAVWRLYWQDARSRAEEFFEIDLAAMLGLPGSQRSLDDPEPAHGLKLFFLFFNRAAFLSQTWDSAQRSFHAYALNEARLYEEKVSQDLGARVFGEIFPRLADALARGDLQARTQPTGYGSYTRQQFTRDYLDEVREAALVLLYRLLFLFYAEDRLLLPVRDPRYAPYSVRALRERVRDDVDAGRVFSRQMNKLWLDLRGAFSLIDRGDDTIGMPAYNGGLFERARSPLLERTIVPDAVMAPIIDALSRRTEDILRFWINYRDLAVSHLGGIYERLLEYSLVHEVQAAESYHDREEIDRIVARPASFARKVSGSYYTHDDLVRLILRESVGRLADEQVERFEAQLAKWKGKHSLTTAQWALLDGSDGAGQRDALDPATRILELTVCDPAMGSGHFLVSLVDFLADRVLEAAAAASLAVNAQPWAAHLAEKGRAWESPVTARIAHIRRSIKQTAQQRGWAVTDAQLDDRHIVRRMILKKSLFGVDKNPMAVELAKTALWLHTFTVGAPLSFLDHHLKCGDSLHGERLPAVQQGLQALGMLFQQTELQRLDVAARGLAQVADLTDIDIAEANLSKQLAAEADAQVAPLHALLDFWRALRWLLPGWPVDAARKIAKLGDEAARGALVELLSPARNLVAALAAGRIDGKGANIEAANALLARCRALAAEERFFHWWTAFPTVFKADGSGGFDAVVGNPPWDMLQMQEVEWFAERVPLIAMQPRAADRKRMVAGLAEAQPEIWGAFQAASLRADQEQAVVRSAGDYPTMAEGRSNLYKLFAERSEALVSSNGVVALLTPSGIGADLGTAAFFRNISTTGRLATLFDFENKGVFFPDVHDNFKFVVVVFGGRERRFAKSECAFYLYRVDELDTPNRKLYLQPEDFKLLNPNTGAAPVFRSQRDATITTSIYRSAPVLVRHRTGGNDKPWPIRFAQGKYNMSSDSGLFKTAPELEQLGFCRTALNRWARGTSLALPLWVGKMIWHYDHRASGVNVNLSSLQVATSSAPVSVAQHSDPSFIPEPQYWVVVEEESEASQWGLGFRDITNPTNVRTSVASIIPYKHTGNTLAQLLPDSSDAASTRAAWIPLLLANLNSLAFDYVTRQKAKWTHLNWFILEQLPVIAPERFDAPLPPAFAARMREAGLMNGHHAHPIVADFVIPQVLALSYTAHDLAPFARDLGYVDAAGQVLPPIIWNDEDRRARLAALDALFMHLYGLGEDDAAYILDTFPIVRQQDEAAFGRWRTKEDVLALLGTLRP